MSPLDNKALLSANQIKQASERAAGLTRQLLASAASRSSTRVRWT